MAGSAAGVAGRARTIRRRLLIWGVAHYQRFAWRDETDPWLTLVAEVMLQRTRAVQAERAFGLFKERYPRAETFAAASDAEVSEATAGLGLHWRGPMLRETAQAIAANGGAPPENEAALRRLPGVGPYAAAAWLSLHRGRRAVIVDNNVARWLCRMAGVAYTAETRRQRWLWELADSLTPRRGFREYNCAVLDFTMLLCRPGVPACGECPLRSECQFALSLPGAARKT